MYEPKIDVSTKIFKTHNPPTMNVCYFCKNQQKLRKTEQRLQRNKEKNWTNASKKTVKTEQTLQSNMENLTKV